MRTPAVIIAAGLFVLPAGAATVDRLDVEYEKKRYTVDSQITIAAPIAAVFEVLADYDDFERVSSIFKDSRYVTREDNGNGTVYTRVEDCILFYCKSIERTEKLELEAPTRIATVAIPEKSDLRYGTSLWVLSDDNGVTRIRYQMELEPDFWVPPVIGPYFVKRFLRKGSGDAADRVEQYALEAVSEAAELTASGDR